MKKLLVSLFIAFCVMGMTRKKYIGFSDIILLSNGDITFSGWVKIHGEILIFSSEEAMRALDPYPKCISGTLKGVATDKLIRYDGQEVTVTGTIIDYDKLESDETPFFDRKLLDGATLPNACLGDRVILLKSIIAHHKP